mmetsp:Transcript_2246/g.2193  ORF Transcript_2246/g.2193 Transcript_2246/m.2193 type:complete len:100 (+) Transcript_2246:1-300(+)
MESKVTLEYVSDNKVAIIKISNEKKLNAVSFEMFVELEKKVEEATMPGKDTRAIILTSNGKHFTAGLDLNSAMQIGTNKGDSADPPRIGVFMESFLGPL